MADPRGDHRVHAGAGPVPRAAVPHRLRYDHGSIHQRPAEGSRRRVHSADRRRRACRNGPDAAVGGSPVPGRPPRRALAALPALHRRRPVRSTLRCGAPGPGGIRLPLYAGPCAGTAAALPREHLGPDSAPRRKQRPCHPCSPYRDLTTRYSASRRCSAGCRVRPRASLSHPRTRRSHRSGSTLYSLVCRALVNASNVMTSGFFSASSAEGPYGTKSSSLLCRMRVGIRISSARVTQSMLLRSSGAASPVSARPAALEISHCPSRPAWAGIRLTRAWWASTSTQLITGPSSTMARMYRRSGERSAA